MSVEESTELESHLVVPGAQHALCAEPLTAKWNGPQPDAGASVTCKQCVLQRYWLPASGDLERDAELDVIVEPRPARRRRHVTGDHDPGRGRLHRPTNLQVCTTCGQLRGPYDRHDNLCACDHRAWDREPRPRAGDLFDNVALCRSCISAIAPGHTRWTSFYCGACRPQVIMLNKLAGRCVVPIGPHSIMNGVFARPDPQLSTTQLISFSDQLTTFFQHTGNLHERTTLRVRGRLEEFGVTAHALTINDYLARCTTAGWNAERGFTDFMMSLDTELDEASARELWNVPSEYGQ
jgi:hypothetical protein